MATFRRDQGAGNLDISKNTPNDLPPISALFLIYFDIKAGYTIGWKRSLPGIELEGVVEYKSLPSGLHTVKDDLIYFVHQNNAGISAFINAPAAEESRNARMLAVGAMVPLTYGRLGRCWKHAEKLKEMARYVILVTVNMRCS
jgi:DENN domain-containing protein 11